MERLYNEYRDIVEFRMVYINEAHAADGTWPVAYAKDKGITEHDDYSERCTTAQMLLDDKQLTIPCVIDGMDNKVNRAYSAWPDRVFLIRSDGRLAVAADRGPRGFKPALAESRRWLEAFRAQGEEPALPETARPAGEDRDVSEMFPDDTASAPEGPEEIDPPGK